jgi:pimeloyl-ACP methyl ester carboxylesterase
MDATINGARIHYERTGEGMPVLMLHAGVADHRMWEPQVATFARHFDVIRPDMRGFGTSELPPGRWSPVHDLLRLIDELRLKPAHVVGCSIGAGLAIDFAIEHGERVSKLVLVGPGIGGIHFGAKYPELFADADAAEKAGDHRAILEAEARLWLDGPRRRPGYVKDPIRSLFYEMNSNFGSDWNSAPTDELEPPAAERLQEITAPTLLVVGDEDAPPIFDAVELLMEKVPHARKVVIHDAAHLPNLEHPDEFNSAVLTFLLQD